MAAKFDPSQPIYRSFRHRLKSAFNEGFNLVGLAGAVALSAALLNPLPLLIGAVAEVAYLLFVSDTKWYMDRVEKKFDAEVQARRDELKAQVFPMVRPEVREQFGRLEDMREQIGHQARKEEPWFREAMRKLDFLMEKHLQFAAKEAQFSSYLMSIYDDVYDSLSPEVRRKMARPNVPPKKPPTLEDMRRRKKQRFQVEGDYASAPVIVVPTDEWVRETVSTIQEYYRAEIEQLKADCEAETVWANRNVMEKRQNILERRFEFVGRIGQILSNLGHQMRLMSDTFGLINDEIRARSPEQVLADIDEVVVQTTSLTEAIDEITPMDELVGNLQ